MPHGCWPKFRIIVVLFICFSILLPLIAFSAVVEGVVVDKSGTPVVGASVYIQNFYIMTDENGNFRIVDVTPGKHLLKVTAPSFYTYLNMVSVSEGVNSFLVKLKRKKVKLKLAVLVRDYFTDEPLIHAKVEVKGESGKWIVNTDKSGVAYFSGISPQKIEIEVSSLGYIPYRKSLFLSSNLSLDVRLKKAGELLPVKICVVEGNLKPVNGAVVRIGEIEKVTGKRGMVNFNLVSGSYLVEVTYKDWAVADVIRVSSKNRIFTIKMTQVSIPSQNDELVELRGILKLNGYPVEGAMIEFGEKHAVTDSAGEWIIKDVPEGLVHLKVHIPHAAFKNRVRKALIRDVWIWAKRGEVIELDLAE